MSQMAVGQDVQGVIAAMLQSRQRGGGGAVQPPDPTATMTPEQRLQFELQAREQLGQQDLAQQKVAAQQQADLDRQQFLFQQDELAARAMKLEEQRAAIRAREAAAAKTGAANARAAALEELEKLNGEYRQVESDMISTAMQMKAKEGKLDAANQTWTEIAVGTLASQYQQSTYFRERGQNAFLEALATASANFSAKTAENDMFRESGAGILAQAGTYLTKEGTDYRKQLRDSRVESDIEQGLLSGVMDVVTADLSKDKAQVATNAMSGILSALKQNDVESRNELIRQNLALAQKSGVLNNVRRAMASIASVDTTGLASVTGEEGSTGGTGGAVGISDPDKMQVYNRLVGYVQNMKIAYDGPDVPKAPYDVKDQQGAQERLVTMLGGLTSFLAASENPQADAIAQAESFKKGLMISFNMREEAAQQIADQAVSVALENAAGRANIIKAQQQILQKERELRLINTRTAMTTQGAGDDAFLALSEAALDAIHQARQENDSESDDTEATGPSGS